MPSHSATTTDRNRNISIDTLRGLACIALVSFHVVGYAPDKGMELPADHWLVVMNTSLVDMRMPLFSFLSGVVFIALEQASRPVGQMLVSKLRRLFVPLLSVGGLFWLAQGIMGQDQQPLLSIPFMPFAHFWFLQATLLVMGSFLILNALRPGHSAALACAMMCGGAVWWLVGPRPPVNLFSFGQALYLMPFFMLGYLCSYARRCGAWRPLSGGVTLLVLVSLGGLGFLLASHLLEPAPLLRRVLTLGIGAGFCLTLLALAPRNPFLARIGHFSYAIFLFHVFFTAGTLKLLGQVWPLAPDAALWVFGCVIGLSGPILIQHVLTQNTYLAGIFLGTRIKPVTPRKSGARIDLPVAHSREAQRA